MFARWKERFFVLTKDYLQCFRKGSSPKLSEMGAFSFKIRLSDIESVELVDKRGYLTISMTLSKEGNSGKILLRKTEGIRTWFQMIKVTDVLQPRNILTHWRFDRNGLNDPRKGDGSPKLRRSFGPGSSTPTHHRWSNGFRLERTLVSCFGEATYLFFHLFTWLFQKPSTPIDPSNIIVTQPWTENNCLDPTWMCQWPRPTTASLTHQTTVRALSRPWLILHSLSPNCFQIPD